MVHMPSLEIWEWGLKIFAGAPTLTMAGQIRVNIHTQGNYGNRRCVCMPKVILYNKTVSNNILYITYNNSNSLNIAVSIRQCFY